MPDKKKSDIIFYQSNIEGELINIINTQGKDFNAIIINPAAYTHTSLALYDSLNNLSILKMKYIYRIFIKGKNLDKNH